MATEISDSQDNGGRFTNLLFELTFVHCAMVIPFILHSPPLFFCISLHMVRNSPMKVPISSQPLFMTSRKTLLAYMTAINNVITIACYIMNFEMCVYIHVEIELW